MVQMRGSVMKNFCAAGRRGGGGRDLGICHCSAKAKTILGLPLEEEKKKKKKRRRKGIASAKKIVNNYKSSVASPISVLPADLVALVLCRLSLLDSVRSAAVCSSWNSIISKLPTPEDLPWLMLPRSKADQINSVLTFYSLSHRQEFSIHVPSRWSRCVTSSAGWLVIADHHCNLHILNPLTGVRIPLPPTITLPVVALAPKPDRRLYASGPGDPNPWDISTRGLVHYLFEKAVVVWTSPSTYTVVLIYRTTRGNSLAFARQGDAAWNTLAADDPPDFKDLIYYKEKLYAARGSGVVEAYNLSCPFPAAVPVRVADAVSAQSQHTMNYLVESPGGDVLQVLKYALVTQWPCEAMPRCETVRFEVLKLIPDGRGGRRWVMMESLGDIALFVGTNYSRAFSTRGLPWLKANCIYYTDDEDLMPYRLKRRAPDLGVFDLASGSFGSYYPHCFRPNCPLPLWFFPNLSKQGVGSSE